MSRHFVLISRWHLDCSVGKVWDVLMAVEQWPRWWPQLLSARHRCSGQADGVGSVADLQWRSMLGYRLKLQVTTLRAQAPSELEAQARGDLTGSGLWILQPGKDGGVIVTYRWDVRLDRPWMKLWAPLLRPLFAWSHFVVMRAGARGMAKYLSCRIHDYADWQRGDLRVAA